jgi:hypothetical protein
MSEHVTGHYGNQSVLFPSMLDDYVDKENPNFRNDRRLFKSALVHPTRNF